MATSIGGTGESIHQGHLVENYRKCKKWSRERLAMELHVDTSTVYRMEQQIVIKSLERRRLLVGLLGIPAAMLGIESSVDFIRPLTKLNNDHMAFLEEGLAVRWDMYHTGGTVRANRGLDVWIEETKDFARKAAGTIWRDRALTTLIMSYQLQGSISRDLMQYDKSHISYQKAYTIAKEANDPELIAATLARRGVAFIQQDQPEKAVEYLNGAYQTINGQGLPHLRGYILQALSEAYGQLKESRESWHHLDLAEHALRRQTGILERTHCQANTTSVTAQRGVNAFWLADYSRAVWLIDKGLCTYDPTFVRGRARLMAQKAEALYGLHDIAECVMVAEEALVLANSVGSTKTIARVKNLHESLVQSRWKAEPNVARLGVLLWKE